MPPRSADDDAPRPWKEHARETGPDLTIARVRFDHLEHPRSGRVMRRVVLETPDWVNVVALTGEGELVLVRQWRFGVRSVTLEIPGGMLEKGESPEEGARRELREETGFAAQRWTYLGAVQPNPAFHDNLCHHLLAEGAVRVGDPQPDEGEDLQVVTLPPVTVRGAIRAGTIRHGLVLNALSHLMDLRGPLPATWQDGARR